ncbi:hypothetical protein ACFSTC_15515 [Nonomuraea ferruginea]
MRTVGDAVQDAFDRCDVRRAVEDVAELAAFDRYQASDGIRAAAEYVAGRAERAGLSDVRLLEFPADGARRWWSFRAPLSWTPVRAAIGDVVRYPEQPFALAAGSAATPPGGVTVTVAPLADAGEGSLAVHDDPGTPVPVAITRAASAGAFGLVTDRLPGPGRVELLGRERPGRLQRDP